MQPTTPTPGEPTLVPPREPEAPLPVATCPNCQSPLAAYASYCGYCGQKQTTGKVTLYQLAAEFFDSVFNIDNRALRTLAALLRPGKLTEAYFQGRQQRYMRPLRLFFISSLLLLAVVGFVALEAWEEEIARQSEKEKEMDYRAYFLAQLAQERDSLLLQYPRQAAALAPLTDTLISQLRTHRSDSTSLAFIEMGSGQAFAINTIQVARRDIVAMPPDSLLNHYQQEGFIRRLSLKQALKISTQGSGLAGYILSKMVWMIILLMPALALVLRLLYVRRSHYFVEHLVFLFHGHAFTFLLISAFLIAYAMNWVGEETGRTLALILIPVYILLAMRRYYRQRWFKTIAKFAIFNFFYLILASVLLILTFVFSALTY